MNQHSNDIILRNGRPVMRAFYLAIKYQVEAALPGLAPDEHYTAREICDEPFWKLLGTPGLRQQAGRCLAHLVASGGISLEFTRRKRNSSHLYRLRKTNQTADTRAVPIP